MSLQKIQRYLPEQRMAEPGTCMVTYEAGPGDDMSKLIDNYRQDCLNPFLKNLQQQLVEAAKKDVNPNEHQALDERAKKLGNPDYFQLQQEGQRFSLIWRGDLMNEDMKTLVKRDNAFSALRILSPTVFKEAFRMTLVMKRAQSAEFENLLDQSYMYFSGIKPKFESPKT